MAWCHAHAQETVRGFRVMSCKLEERFSRDRRYRDILSRLKPPTNVDAISTEDAQTTPLTARHRPPQNVPRCTNGTCW